MIFAYVALTGRRLGPPMPLDPRPPRSSLEYVRGFAGLVRRSGRQEIVRDRLGELRTRLAGRELRGEVTVLVAGAEQRAAPALDLDAEIRAARAAGRSVRELSVEIARRTGLSRGEVYRRMRPQRPGF